MGDVQCLVLDERIVTLYGAGPWNLGSAARGQAGPAFDGGARPPRLVAKRTADGVAIEALDDTPLVLRGERRARHCIVAGDAVAAGRWQVLAAELAGPSTVRWQGMLATATASLRQLTEIARAANSRAPVFIGGESGTGKELAAHAIHQAGARRARPFLALNCAALPDTLAESELFGVERGAYTGATRTRAGAFVQAHGGTLFLDEVGELSPLIQAKLLRTLETGEVQPVGSGRTVKIDVRIVCASWRDLERQADEGRFRTDLLHRLNVLRVDLVPLRERREDILPLVADLLARHDGDELAPDPALAVALVAAPWWGNVRELKNGVLRAIASGDARDLLPRERAFGRGLLGMKRAEVRTREVLASTLHHFRGNRARSARALGISRSTLYRWMATFAHNLGESQPGGSARAPGGDFCELAGGTG